MTDNNDCTNPECRGLDGLPDFIADYVEIGKWAVIGVLGETTEQGHKSTFSYTVGLHYQNLPELIMVGLNASLAIYILNHCAEMMIEQGEFVHGTQIDELASMPTVIIDVQKEGKKSHAAQAYNHYRHWGFRMQQLVMPDKNGLFPWEKDYCKKMQTIQSILGRPPKGKCH